MSPGGTRREYSGCVPGFGGGEPKPRHRRAAQPAKADLSSLSSMLQARWKGSLRLRRPAEPLQAGQIRTFKIVKLEPESKRIEVELG